MRLQILVGCFIMNINQYNWCPRWELNWVTPKYKADMCNGPVELPTVPALAVDSLEWLLWVRKRDAAFFLLGARLDGFRVMCRHWVKYVRELGAAWALISWDIGRTSFADGLIHGWAGRMTSGGSCDAASSSSRKYVDAVPWCMLNLSHSWCTGRLTHFGTEVAQCSGDMLRHLLLFLVSSWTSQVRYFLFH